MTLAEQFDKIKDQEWYQQIKSAYDQLSPEQQNYVKWGSFAALLAALGMLIISTLRSAHTVKAEYYEKQALVQQITQATDEIRRLKGQNAGFSQAGTQNWRSIIQNLASGQGLPPASIEVTKELPGASQNVIQETLLEVQVKSVSTRPLTQLVFQIEHGNPPMKLKGMKIENLPDGMLNATLSISGYLPKPEKGK